MHLIILIFNDIHGRALDKTTDSVSVSSLLLSHRPRCPPSSPYYPSFPPFLSAVFFLHLYSRAPLTESLEQIHMSHQFTEIPIVFSQCAPLRGLWVSQHGLVYMQPHIISHNSGTPCCTLTQIYRLVHCMCTFLCIHCFLSESHHMSFSPNWTVNKQYNMAHQEAPYRPVS